MRVGNRSARAVCLLPRLSVMAWFSNRLRGVNSTQRSLITAARWARTLRARGWYALGAWLLARRLHPGPSTLGGSLQPINRLFKWVEVSIYLRISARARCAVSRPRGATLLRRAYSGRNYPLLRGLAALHPVPGLSGSGPAPPGSILPSPTPAADPPLPPDEGTPG